MLKQRASTVAAIVSVCLLATMTAGRAWAQATATVVGPAGSRVKGEFVAQGDAYAVKSPTATVVFGDSGSTNYRLTFEVQFDASKANSLGIRVFPADPMDYTKPYAVNVGAHAPLNNIYITTTPWHFDATGKAVVGSAKNFYYAPYAATPELQAAAAKALAEEGGKPGTWKGRWLPVRVDVVGNTVAVWFEGQVVDLYRSPTAAAGPVSIDLYEGELIRRTKLEPVQAGAMLVPLDITPLANDRFAKPLVDAKAAGGAVDVGGVPFELSRGEDNQISLRRAEWYEWKKDPSDYYENYDGGPAFVNDPRMPYLRVPAQDYSAVHILAVADEDPGALPMLTMRAGRYGWSDQVVTYDFQTRVPRASEAAKVNGKDVLNTPAGPLFHVRVPWTESFAYDIGNGIIDVELTKEVRLARHASDPNRFRYRPLGLPSGVRIAAITFERSPLQMKVSTKESANAFVQPQKPTIDVSLQNVTGKDQAYTLTVEATHYYGEKETEKKSGKVKAGETASVAIPLDLDKRGYYDVAVTLLDGDKQPLLVRHTSLAVLPPDTRKHRLENPFGTWDFGGGHYANPDSDRDMSLQRKMGLHYTGGGPYEARKKYGLILGNELNVAGSGADAAKAWGDHLKLNPDAIRQAMIFHETTVDYDSILRVPDLFIDWPAYELPPKSKETFDKLWAGAEAAVKSIRAAYPETKITFGNNTLSTREEFFKAKWPHEYFDYCGNEAGNFGRPPESQPPDVVADNSSFWMDRQLLDAYGYKDKPIQHCYEACYVNTNPGNVALRDQADYYVRHCMHALAWEFPYIRYAMANDVGNSYYYSNWGASGLCHRYPEVNPKPAYVAMATMTLMLDGARFVRDIKTDFASVYVLEFAKADGSHVWVMWTLRGQRLALFHINNAGKLTLTDSQGIESKVYEQKNGVHVTLTPSPVYLSGTGELIINGLDPSQFDDAPANKSKTTPLVSLASMDEWTLETERDPHLEFYSLLCPRRKGDFEFTSVDAFEGQKGMLRVTPKPITTGKEAMPMYAALRHKTGVPVPGTPTEVGLWINGNSGFGRVFFEFEDASGQKWTSIGAPSTDPAPGWMKTVVPAELQSRFTPPLISDWNTDDVFGWSRINFDGWRYVAFPMPGQFPGEGYHWPANSQWRWDKDGIVHYPLKLTRLIVELPEKVLHVKTYAPPKRPAIYLKDLIVSQGDTQFLKPQAREE